MALPIVVEVTMVGEVEGCPNPPITPPPSLGGAGGGGCSTPLLFGSDRLPTSSSAFCNTALNPEHVINFAQPILSVMENCQDIKFA